MNLQFFKTESFYNALQSFFEELNIPVNYVAEEPINPQEILSNTYKSHHPAFRLMKDVYFLGMVDDASFEENQSITIDKIKTDYDGILIFGVTLKQRENYLLPTRSQLAEITRAFNREFHYTPVVVIFKYKDDSNNYIAFANTERLKYKQEWREGEKAGKVSLLRDIDIDSKNIHAGHERILLDLIIKRSGKGTVNNFKVLYNYWQSVFNISVLNKEFYQKLFNWYLWTLQEVKFPQIRADSDKIDDKIHQSESLIRLLTRLLFVWFMKEKGLINPDIFNVNKLKSILKNYKGINGEETIFYNAILQNLFFATLNKPIEQRKVIDKGFNPKEYGDPLVYRYDELFCKPENVLKYFENIPFLNGGLFECLDQKKDKENPVEIRLDGFSTRKSKQVNLPDKYFFGEYKNIDLSKDYDDKKKNKLTVYGIIDILNQYKFTVEENTPIEEEIALDPELLGKVFENLLASYNPETQTTARKKTGSFYTPREIVNYMVDESLIAYLKNNIDDEERLRDLFSYNDKTKANPFNTSETKILVSAIDDCRILDPACGSGAFPMGVLQKLTHILHKLDPENHIWFDMVITNLPVYMQTEARKKLEKENWNYVRKLGIVQQCIYGIDIQPIATQIAKLRFFISLLVDQNEKPDEPNRGFEPLPNLDFKIATANTLISAPENKAIEAYAKNEVRNFEKLTNEYFSAVADEKISIKEEIKKCTQKIVDANQRVINQWIDKIKRESKSSPAKKKKMQREMEEYQQVLNLWSTFPNIYKHESVAFFETKYFFPQVKDGFDVVIGNPPYVSAVSMAKTKKEKKLFKKLFPLATGTYDIYILFLLKAIQLLNNTGKYSWIIPNKFLIADYAIKTKEYLEKNGLIYSIDVSSFNVFENTSVYPVVIIGDKQKQDISLQEFLLDKYTDLEIRKFKNPLKLYNHKNFKDFNIKIGSGATGFEANKIKEIVSSKNDKNTIPFTVSGCVDKYTYSNKNVRYMGLKLENAFVTESTIIADSKWKFWKKEKIVIAGMTKEIEAVYVKESLGLGVGIYAIYDFGEFNPYFLTGVLNSKYLSFYFKNKFKDKHLAGGYLAINKSTIEKLPLEFTTKQFSLSKISLMLSFIVNFMRSKTYFDLINEVSDALVFELYFSDHMKECEIDILQFVEQDISKVIQERDFEKLSDKEKQEVIEQLHQKWSNSDSEVKKRIDSFAEKSPDILKPIIESK